MCNTNHFRCWSSPDIIGFGWNMLLLSPFWRRRVLPVLAACWPQGAHTAGSIPCKISQVKKKESTEMGSPSTASISSGNCLAHLNKGFCFALQKCSCLCYPSGWTKSCQAEDAWPSQGAQGPQHSQAVTQPGVHMCNPHTSWVTVMMICQQNDLEWGASNPLGRICTSYLSWALVYGWMQKKRTPVIINTCRGGKPSETGLLQLLCCGKWKWTIKMECKVLCCNSL